MTMVYARMWRLRPAGAVLRRAMLRRATRWEKRLPPSMRAAPAQDCAGEAAPASVSAPAPACTSANRNRTRHASRRHTSPLPRANSPVWSGRLRHHFIKGLAATGNVRRTARTLGVHHTTFYARRKADPGLAALWKQAMKLHINTVIDQLMFRAAFGWEEDVWYRNEHLGKRRVYDHRMAMQLVLFVDKRDREDRAEAAALAAETARIAETCTGRSARVGGGVSGDAGEEGISPNHALMLDLMHRHRNRHPQEWDGDVHIQSGFDFGDWESWVAGYEARRRKGEGHALDDGAG